MSFNSDQSKVSIWCLASIAAVPLIMTLGNSMLIPVLPILEKKVSISSFQSSLIITSYSVASILLIPIAGYLSDRFGRKMILLPSLAITFIGGLVSGFASWKMSDPYMVIIIGRIIQGIGSAGAFPIILPLVGDLYKDDDEASACLGIVETSNTFGKVLSPILGAALALWIWYIPFFSISVFSLISFLMVLFFIKVPKKKDEPPKLKDFLQQVKKIFHTDGRWLYSVFITGAFIMLILFAVQFYLSNILESKYDIHNIKKGFILAIPLFFLCIASFITGKKIKDNIKAMKILIIISLVISCVSICFTSHIDNLYLLIGVLSIFGAGLGAILPSLDALITENIEKEQRGTITSFYSSARFFGVAAGPPLMSYFLKENESYLFYSFSILSVLLIILIAKCINAESPA
ncbi:MFS transporter [Bacillus sp. FJAT-27916]|uniref:MFS transporter n=1 Tax=Bacillus sp. FJAT-27916 TaxID=1679169 RepID=UPI0006710F8E|nr:MFS transporter [Bacillus sp. FJAT-27916]KMY45184.1 MFS transporter [Bacillus sp. FJAT-27916]